MIQQEIADNLIVRVWVAFPKSGHKYAIGIQKNAVFVIDATRLKSPDDIRADDLGVWVNNGVRHSFLTCKSVGNIISKVEVVSKERNMPLRWWARENHTSKKIFF